MPKLLQGTWGELTQIGLLQILGIESMLGLGISHAGIREGVWTWEIPMQGEVWLNCIRAPGSVGGRSQRNQLSFSLWGSWSSSRSGDREEGAGRDWDGWPPISHLIFPGDILHGYDTVALMLRRLAAGLTNDQSILFAEHL